MTATHKSCYIYCFLEIAEVRTKSIEKSKRMEHETKQKKMKRYNVEKKEKNKKMKRYTTWRKRKNKKGKTKNENRKKNARKGERKKKGKQEEENERKKENGNSTSLCSAHPRIPQCTRVPGVSLCSVLFYFFIG